MSKLTSSLLTGIAFGLITISMYQEATGYGDGTQTLQTALLLLVLVKVEK